MGGGTSKVLQSVAGRFEGPGNLRGNPIWFPGRIQGGVIGRVFQWIAGHTWLVPQTGAELSGRQSLHKSRTGAVASIRRWGWVFACEHGGPERTGPTLAPVVLRILSFEATSAKDTLKTPCGGLLSPLTGRMGMLPSPPQSSSPESCATWVFRRLVAGGKNRENGATPLRSRRCNRGLRPRNPLSGKQGESVTFHPAGRGGTQADPEARRPAQMSVSSAGLSRKRRGCSGSGWSVAAPGRDGQPHNIAVGRRALRARLAGTGNLGLFPRRGIA